MPTLSLGHQATFHNTKHFSQASNLEVIEKSNKPDFDEQLRYMRLMHLTRCLHSAPAALLALLDAAFFYISQDAVDLIADFQWVKDSNGDRLVLPEADNIGQWLDLALDTRAWRNLIRLTSKLSLAQTQDQRRLQLWRKEITDIYLVMKLTPPPFAPLPEADSNFLCYTCGDTLATSAGWHHHMRAHGLKPLARQYVSSSICLACNTDFHSIAKVFAHLRGRPQCLATMADNFQPLNDEQIDSTRALELQQDQITLEPGFCHRKTFVRPIRRCGPVLFCPYSKSQARDRQAKPIAVATECMELLDIAVINVELQS